MMDQTTPPHTRPHPRSKIYALAIAPFIIISVMRQLPPCSAISTSSDVKDLVWIMIPNPSQVDGVPVLALLYEIQLSSLPDLISTLHVQSDGIADQGCCWHHLASHNEVGLSSIATSDHTTVDPIASSTCVITDPDQPSPSPIQSETSSSMVDEVKLITDPSPDLAHGDTLLQNYSRVLSDMIQPSASPTFRANLDAAEVSVDANRSLTIIGNAPKTMSKHQAKLLKRNTRRHKTKSNRRKPTASPMVQDISTASSSHQKDIGVDTGPASGSVDDEQTLGDPLQSVNGSGPIHSVLSLLIKDGKTLSEVGRVSVDQDHLQIKADPRQEVIKGDVSPIVDGVVRTANGATHPPCPTSVSATPDHSSTCSPRDQHDTKVDIDTSISVEGMTLESESDRLIRDEDSASIHEHKGLQETANIESRSIVNEESGLVVAPVVHKDQPKHSREQHGPLDSKALAARYVEKMIYGRQLPLSKECVLSAKSLCTAFFRFIHRISNVISFWETKEKDLDNFLQWPFAQTLQYLVSCRVDEIFPNDTEALLNVAHLLHVRLTPITNSFCKYLLEMSSLTSPSILDVTLHSILGIMELIVDIFKLVWRQFVCSDFETTIPADNHVIYFASLWREHVANFAIDVAVQCRHKLDQLVKGIDSMKARTPMEVVASMKSQTAHTTANLLHLKPKEIRKLFKPSKLRATQRMAIKREHEIQRISKCFEVFQEQSKYYSSVKLCQALHKPVKDTLFEESFKGILESQLQQGQDVDHAINDILPESIKLALVKHTQTLTPFETSLRSLFEEVSCHLLETVSKYLIHVQMFVIFVSDSAASQLTTEIGNVAPSVIKLVDSLGPVLTDIVLSSMVNYQLDLFTDVYNTVLEEPIDESALMKGKDNILMEIKDLFPEPEDAFEALKTGFMQELDSAVRDNTIPWLINIKL